MKLTKSPECVEALIRDWRVDEVEAKLILDILDGNTTYVDLYEAEHPKVNEQERRMCDRVFNPGAQKLTAVDIISEGTFGVMSYGGDDEGTEPAWYYYLQTGDLYNPTIAWSSGDQEFLLTTEMDVRAACELRENEELSDDCRG